MDQILSGLNEKQKEAVQSVDGPLLVIAGPGSGKTKVLIHRIAYLIERAKVNPKNILAVTFTNKAAGEMKERVKKIFQELRKLNFRSDRSLTSVVYGHPTISTFHSFCVRVLRFEIGKLGWKKTFLIYDDKDQLALIKKVMTDLEMDTEIFNPFSIQKNISAAKNELIDYQSYQNQKQGYFEEQVGKVYQRYQNELKKNNALDFDDLIMLTVKLFQKNPMILKKYQQRFRYILIDEYQDTNYAQYILAKLLAAEHKNICVVGDVDQGIYSWRGADIRNILSFEKDYPEAKVVFLDQSYRSTQKILEAAHNIISKNVQRKEKKLWTEKKEGFPLINYEAADEKDEAEFILQEIEKLSREHGFNFSDFAVFYRTNSQSRSLEEAFLNRNFHYKIVGGIKFYQRSEIKDILSYLRALWNPKDIFSFSRIINLPTRGIGQLLQEKVMEIFRQENEDFIKVLLSAKNIPEITDSQKEKLENAGKIFQKLKEKISSSKLTDLIKFLLEEIHYKEWLEKGKEGEKRWENVQELLTVANRYDNLNPPEGLIHFLEDVSLIQDTEDLGNKGNQEDKKNWGDKGDNLDKNNAVSLMTLHSAKGLEFPVVFIVGMEEGLLPHSRSIRMSQEGNLNFQLEEERRLCYVGITRAKEKVYLICARQRNLFGARQANPPSRFLKDIPENLIKCY
jgi:DNA helicase-2/ATP-dependent DNA helicase PcrA